MGRVGAAELGTQQLTTDGRDASRAYYSTFHQNYYYYSEPCVNNNNNNFRSTPEELTAAKPRGGPRSAPVLRMGGEAPLMRQT